MSRHTRYQTARHTRHQMPPHVKRHEASDACRCQDTRAIRCHGQHAPHAITLPLQPTLPSLCSYAPDTALSHLSPLPTYYQLQLTYYQLQPT